MIRSGRISAGRRPVGGNTRRYRYRILPLPLLRGGDGGGDVRVLPLHVPHAHAHDRVHAHGRDGVPLPRVRGDVRGGVLPFPLLQ